MRKPPVRNAPVIVFMGDDFIVALRRERELIEREVADRREQQSGDVEPGRGSDSMSDEKSGSTSSEYAKAKREAHVPEVTPETSPEKPGDEHGSGEIANRLVQG